jgi:hypothetical protein
MLRMPTRPLTDTLAVFRALGDETRLRLIELLRDGEQCVCDLTGELKVGQSPWRAWSVPSARCDRRDARCACCASDATDLFCVNRSMEIDGSGGMTIMGVH